MKIVFFGSGALSAHVLAYITNSLPTVQIVAVVTKPEPARRHRSQPNPIIAIAAAHHIPVLQPTDLRAVATELQALGATAGLLFAYGKILPPELLAVFPAGILNIHPSLLPKHRGPSPIEATILAGDAEAGVSLMIITQDMDAGPVIAQTAFSVSPEISKDDLTAQLLTAAKQLLADHLVNYLRTGQPTAQPQDETKASYCSLIKKADGNLTLAHESALSFTRKVRAYQGWPGVRLAIYYHNNPTELSVRAAHVETEIPRADESISLTSAGLTIHTQTGSIVLDQVQLPGKRPISGRDLSNGGEISLATRTT